MHCPCFGVNVLALCATQRRTQLNVSRMPVACMHRLPLCIWDLRVFMHNCDSTLRAFQRLVCIACLYAFGTCAFLCIIATQHFALSNSLYASLAFMHLGLARFSAYIATQRFALSNGLYASLAFMRLGLVCFSAYIATQRFALSSGLCIPLVCPHIWLPGASCQSLKAHR